MASCIMWPTVKVGNKQVESQLFKDIYKYTNDRESSKHIWGLLQSPEFIDSIKDSLTFTDLNEPTFESVKDVLKLEDILSPEMELKRAEEVLGAVKKDESIMYYNSVSEIINKVIGFNKDNPKTVATISSSDKGYNIIVSKLNTDNLNDCKELVFSNEVNNKLRGILRSMGFDVDLSQDVPKGFGGMFSPLSGKTTAEGLKTVIKIAKGQLGEESFPEEFSHVIIEGLHNNPLVSRTLNSLNNEDTLKLILGDKYEVYKKQYNNDSLKIRKEAAAVLLQRHILGQPIIEHQSGLIGRLWSLAKKLFGKHTEADVETILEYANRAFAELTPKILDKSIIPTIDKEAILNAETLYSALDDVTSMEKLAIDAEAILNKRIKLIQVRTGEKDVTEEDKATLDKLQDLLSKKEYAKSSIAFLVDALDHITTLNDKIKIIHEKDTDKMTEFEQIKLIATPLKNIKEFSEGYAEIINKMRRLPAMQQMGEVELTEEDAKLIGDKATEISNLLNDIKGIYDKQRFNVTYNFLKPIWGEDKFINIGKDKGKRVTLKGILNHAEKDIGIVNRLLSSMSDASDPLLSLIDKSVKLTQSKRDAKLEDLAQQARAHHNELINAGYNPEFMYERDSAGKLTGKLISDLNFEQYDKDRKAQIKMLKSRKLSPENIAAQMETWDLKHSEMVKLNESGREEQLPNKDMYSKDSLSSLAPAQRTYYDNMIKLKREMDLLIPERYTNTYKAVQLNNDISESIVDNISDPKKATKMALEAMQDNFVRRADDTHYGEVLKEGTKKKFLDFANKPLEKIPVHFTNPLADMDRLSTDFTGSLLAYAGMAINYNEMDKVIDTLEVARDLVHDREVQQMSGEDRIMSTFKLLNKTFESKFTKEGRDSNIGKRIDDYYAAQIYGQSKIDMGTWKVFNKEVDKAQAIDTIKGYTRVLGMGLNTFSGISNVLIGKMQMFIEGVAGEHFNMKNAVIAKKNYFSLLPTTLGELSSTKKSGKLDLLMDKFDAKQDFLRSVSQDSNFKGLTTRILGGANIYFMSTMGEHYLHSRTMLAMLDAHKVKDASGKEMSLFDAFEVKDTKVKGKTVSSKLVIKEGVTNTDGSKITEEEVSRLKLRIGKVNQSMHGAFNSEDKGAINRWALGRLAMQFKQWMPAHYARRLGSTKYDAQLEQYREGYYRTLGRFSKGIMKDLMKGKFQFATRIKGLNPHEQANMKRAFTEVAMFGILMIITSLMGSAKDRKGKWAERMAIYQLKRLELETGASIPFMPQFIENVMTMVQSPAAGINSFNNLMQLVYVTNWNTELQSGRYKGMSVWTRDALRATPMYNQIKKVTDLSDEEYMFTLFK